MSNITKAIAALGVVAGLGVAALPLSSYAAEFGPVKVTAVIDSSISVTASSNTVDLGSLIVGGAPATGTVDVTVSTNEVTGYTLAISDLNEINDMVNLASADDKIPAGAPVQGTSAWGVKGGSVEAYTAVPANTAAALPLVTTSKASATDGDTTKVTFGVSAGTGLGAGTYEDEVVFIATVNEATND